MQEIRMYKVTIALTALVLMVTIASMSFTSVTFAAEDANGNRIIYPIPGWKREGPSPWLTMGQNQMIYNLSSGCVNPYSTVPKTPHMLWKYQTGPGGVAGGFNPANGYYEGQSFVYQWGAFVVGGGRVYSETDLYPEQSHIFKCVDEETGQLLWTSDLIPGSAQYRFQLMQKAIKTGAEGGTNTLVEPTGNKAYFIDGGTGKLVFTYTFPRSISIIAAGWEDSIHQPVAWDAVSADEVYAYGVTSNTARDNIAYCYKFIDNDGKVISPAQLMWETPTGNSLNLNQVMDEVLCGRSDAASTMTGINRFTGEILWVTPISSWQGNGGFGYGRYYISGNDNRIYGLDMHTGEITWQAEVASNNFYPQHGVTIGNGGIFVQGYEGVARKFDKDTGELLWQYYIGDCPYEPYKSWYGTWADNQVPTGGIDAYICQTGDHIGHNPKVPGERFYVYNATTGHLMWSFSNVGDMHNDHSVVVADGMLFAHDSYTGQMRGFGRGPAAVEISVDSTRIPLGESVWITGSVTDASAAQPGTPCVSEKDMGPWMEYLHCGMPQPAYGTMTGVPITLYAQGTDGKTITIGTVTTNGDTGRFSMLWTPQSEDLYTITGVFLTDSSYWTAYGSTELSIRPAAIGSNSSSTTAAVTVATLAAVVVGGIVIRKHPFKKREEIEK